MLEDALCATGIFCVCLLRNLAFECCLLWMNSCGSISLFGYCLLCYQLPALVNSNFPVDMDRNGITGHSMGGHGALVCALKNPGLYQVNQCFALHTSCKMSISAMRQSTYEHHYMYHLVSNCGFMYKKTWVGLNKHFCTKLFSWPFVQSTAYNVDEMRSSDQINHALVLSDKWYFHWRNYELLKKNIFV